MLLSDETSRLFGWALAIEGYEAITIVAILAIIFLWGPQKLPEIARSIGQARREFERASKEVSTLRDVTSTTQPMNAETPQDPVLIAAKSLGIGTEGKTKEELAKEIVDRTTKK